MAIERKNGGKTLQLKLDFFEKRNRFLWLSSSRLYPLHPSSFQTERIFNFSGLLATVSSLRSPVSCLLSPFFCSIFFTFLSPLTFSSLSILFLWKAIMRHRPTVTKERPKSDQNDRPKAEKRKCSPRIWTGNVFPFMDGLELRLLNGSYGRWQCLTEREREREMEGLRGG